VKPDINIKYQVIIFKYNLFLLEINMAELIMFVSVGINMAELIICV